MTKRHSIALLFLSFLALLPLRIFAAEVRIVTDKDTYATGELVTVRVVADTQGVAINASGGELVYPYGILTPVTTSHAFSILKLWIREPTFTAPGQLSYEGIVVNPGYTGTDGELFRATFQAQEASTATLDLSSAALLANDEQGTNLLVEVIPKQITIVQNPTPNEVLPASADLTEQEDNPEDPSPSCNTTDDDRSLMLLFEDTGSGSTTSYDLTLTGSDLLLKGQDMLILGTNTNLWITPGDTSATSGKRILLTALRDSPVSNSIPDDEDTSHWLLILIPWLLVFALLFDRIRKRMAV